MAVMKTTEITFTFLAPMNFKPKFISSNFGYIDTSVTAFAHFHHIESEIKPR